MNGDEFGDRQGLVTILADYLRLLPDLVFAVKLGAYSLLAVAIGVPLASIVRSLVELRKRS